MDATQISHEAIGYRPPLETLPSRNHMIRMVGAVEAEWSAFLGRPTFLFDPDNSHFGPLYQTTDNPSYGSLLAQFEHGGDEGKRMVELFPSRWNKLPEKERKDLLLLFKAAYSAGWSDYPTGRNLAATAHLMSSADWLSRSEIDRETALDLMKELVVEVESGEWDAERKPRWEAMRQNAETK